MNRLFDTIRRANQPGPAEHSVTLRVASSRAIDLAAPNSAAFVAA